VQDWGGGVSVFVWMKGHRGAGQRYQHCRVPSGCGKCIHPRDRRLDPIKSGYGTGSFLLAENR